MSTAQNTAALYARLPAVARQAHAVCDALQAKGVDCYVRCWHLGQTGWFVVDAKTYERLNFPSNPDAMPSVSRNSRRLVAQAQEQGLACGCYFCGHVGPALEVREFSSDGSALCPHCDMDTVLVNVTDPNRLVEGMEKWFTGTREPLPVPA